MVWPSFYPPQCPPSDAGDPAVKVFRLVSSIPPAVTDFESHAEKNPRKWKGDCKASGLSVFTEKADAEKLARRVPALGGIIASATLSPDAGKIMPTPSKEGNSHHTWWAPDGFDHPAVFKVVP